MKSHLRLSQGPACGRGRVVTDSPRQVTCLLCKQTEAFVKAKMDQDCLIEAEFQAQTPRQVRKMWGDPGNYECHNCGGDLWRERARSLFSYNFVCEGCGTVISPLTETGMST